MTGVSRWNPSLVVNLFRRIVVVFLTLHRTISDRLRVIKKLDFARILLPLPDLLRAAYQYIFDRSADAPQTRRGCPREAAAAEPSCILASPAEHLDDHIEQLVACKVRKSNKLKFSSSPSSPQ